MRSRRAVVLVAMSSWLMMSASAAQAESELSLSLDGVVWTDTISGPLFPSMIWVPGDVETADIYIRNSGGSVGDLTVDVTSRGGGSLADELVLTAQGAGGVWRSVSGPGTHRVLAAPGIADGGIEKVTLHVAFAAGSTNMSQRDSAGLEWLVTLTEGLPNIPEEPTDPGTMGLPDTGSVVERWMLVIAAMSVGAGIAFISARRDRREVPR